MRALARSVVVGIALLVAANCASDQEQPPRAILLVTLDTTRADRLTPYGYMSASMPTFDRLARESVVFDQAISVAPLTLPAHASILTGLLPPSHGLRDNNALPLAPEHSTLAESLHAHGFRTAAFVGASVLASDRGLGQGFDHYGEAVGDSHGVSRAPERRASAVVDEALEWLGQQDNGPIFMWVHLYDPHRPYSPPEPFASRYAHDPYLGEIAYMDAEIGRLIDAFDQTHSNRSLVIIAGDHGESLGEHGERDHGIFVYESVLRVPLIVRTSSRQPRRIGSVVRLTDVMPTVLATAGVAAPKTEGVNLFDVMRGQAAELDAYSESHYPKQFGWSPLRALRDNRFKLIDAPRSELYDLQLDPFETTNLYHERPALVGAMERRLNARSHPANNTVHSSEVSVDPSVRERLAALGYIMRSQPDDSPGGFPDPKDCIDTIDEQSPTRPIAHKRPTAGC
jgi:arylsulfatase A-like enzyme